MLHSLEILHVGVSSHWLSFTKVKAVEQMMSHRNSGSNVMAQVSWPEGYLGRGWGYMDHVWNLVKLSK